MSATKKKKGEGTSKQSLPTGKDRIAALWAEYRKQEQMFCEALAQELIALHKQLAKPHSGSFVLTLAELKIPTSTAYRLMRLHGWKPEQQKASRQEKPLEPIELSKSKSIALVVRYLDRFAAGQEQQEQLEALIKELRGMYSAKEVVSGGE
jgi:hypothetical protein